MPAGSRKLRVVIDTNVFISGLNFAGKPGEVLDLTRLFSTLLVITAR